MDIINPSEVAVTTEKLYQQQKRELAILKAIMQ